MKLKLRKMAKTRTMNELRQEKTYGYRAPFGMTHEEEKEKVIQRSI